MGPGEAMTRPINPLQVERAVKAYWQMARELSIFDGVGKPIPLFEDYPAPLQEKGRLMMTAALEASKTITAPFTPQEVEALNAFQAVDYIHPFTCPDDHAGLDRRLVATEKGWICPHCAYTQAWAHGFMLEAWIGEPRQVDPLRS